MKLPTRSLREQVRAMLEAHWQPEGYTVPNAVSYPFAWMWDSCFHALVWAELGDAERAVRELEHVFRLQEADGFVPHIDYERDPDFHAAFWGRPGRSTITQPPVHAHAIALLRRRGIDVEEELVERSVAHLEWFLRTRRHRSGLISIAHPWETGCDDSARFDAWGAADRATWYERKGAFVGDRGQSLDCAPVSLSAIVAWGCHELAMGDGGLTDVIRSRWDGGIRTWVDAGTGETTSGRVRTLDGLLPLLVDMQTDVLADLADPVAYAGPFGPRGAHRDEATYEPDRYWRGGTWPQLAYLLWRAGATSVAAPTVKGARVSGLAEFWHPETGVGLGAVPQSWTGLVLLMEGISASWAPPGQSSS